MLLIFGKGAAITAAVTLACGAASMSGIGLLGHNGVGTLAAATAAMSAPGHIAHVGAGTLAAGGALLGRSGSPYTQTVTGDRLATPALLPFDADFTVRLTMKPDATFDSLVGYPVIFSGNTGPSDDFMRVFTPAGNNPVQLWLRNDGTEREFAVEPFVHPSVSTDWHTIVLTGKRVGSNMEINLYVDGVSVTDIFQYQKDWPAASGPGNMPLYILTNHAGQAMVAAACFLRVWDSCLTPAQVYDETWSATSLTGSPLVDASLLGSLVDISGNGNDLAMEAGTDSYAGTAPALAVPTFLKSYKSIPMSRRYLHCEAIQTPAPRNLSGCGWFRVDGVPDSSTLFAFAEEGTNNSHFRLYLDSAYGLFIAQGGGARATLTPGAWTHIAFALTVVGTAVSADIFVNGVAVVMGAAYTSPATVAIDLEVCGVDYGDAATSLDGLTSNLRMWDNTLLDATDFTAEMASTTPVTSGVTGSWELNGGRLYNQAGSAEQLRLINRVGAPSSVTDVFSSGSPFGIVYTGTGALACDPAVLACTGHVAHTAAPALAAGAAVLTCHGAINHHAGATGLAAGTTSLAALGLINHHAGATGLTCGAATTTASGVVVHGGAQTISMSAAVLAAAGQHGLKGTSGLVCGAAVMAAPGRVNHHAGATSLPAGTATLSGAGFAAKIGTATLTCDTMSLAAGGVVSRVAGAFFHVGAAQLAGVGHNGYHGAGTLTADRATLLGHAAVNHAVLYGDIHAGAATTSAPGEIVHTTTFSAIVAGAAHLTATIKHGLHAVGNLACDPAALSANSGIPDTAVMFAGQAMLFGTDGMLVVGSISVSTGSPDVDLTVANWVLRGFVEPVILTVDFRAIVLTV